MRIEVTQDHIDAALFMADQFASICLYNEYLGANERCPVALALKEAGFVDARVGYGWLSTGWDNRGILPTKEMQQFIRDFDLKRDVKPFSFELTDDNEVKMR